MTTKKEEDLYPNGIAGSGGALPMQEPSLPSIREDSKPINSISGDLGGACSSSLSIEELFSALETPEAKKQRKRSHLVVYATTVIMTIGFSIVISGTWPYLVELAGGDDKIDKTALGWVIAANPLGQMIASPIMGFAQNKIGNIRNICYFTVTCFTLGNVLYGLLPYCNFWPNSYYHLMIVSRLIVGVSSSNITLCRSYLSSSTTVNERTKAISHISASQSLGLIIGPALQMILVVLIGDDVSRYSSPGWLAAFLGLINLTLLTPCIFTEHSIADKEKDLRRKFVPENSLEGDTALPKPNYIGLIAILFAFFIIQFQYVLCETLMEPFMEDQYELCSEVAVVLVGIIFICAGFLTLLLFFLIAKLAKIFDERKLIIVLGFIPLCIGTFLLLPWGNDKLNYCAYDSYATPSHPGVTLYPFNESHSEIQNVLHSQLLYKSESKHDEMSQHTSAPLGGFQSKVDEKCANEGCLGCPAEQEWCKDYPKLIKFQFIFGYIFIFFGYPFGLAISNTIFSKILGPRPQGTWTGVLTASGSLARIMGPIFVTYIYTHLGTRANFAIIESLMIFGLLNLIINYKRLLPLSILSDGNNDRY